MPIEVIPDHIGPKYHSGILGFPVSAPESSFSFCVGDVHLRCRYDAGPTWMRFTFKDFEILLGRDDVVKLIEFLQNRLENLDMFGCE